MRTPVPSTQPSRASVLKACCFAPLSVLILVAGCAVLTVDVDVYKGPLANHPKVQLQQASAMAIAATPLLVQLTSGIASIKSAMGPLDDVVTNLTSILPCVKAAALDLADVLASADPTNRTIQLWRQMKASMLADIVAFKTLKKSADDAQADVSGLVSKLAELEKRNDRLRHLSNTQAAIVAWKGIDPKERDNTFRGLRRDLAEKKQHKDKAEASADAKASGTTWDQISPPQAADALVVLDEFNPPLDVSELKLPDETDGGRAFAKDALDALIARLRYEHLQTVAETGENSPRSTALADAIRIAYQERTGMISIRPASSYLRTSYPATSLQTDASIGWKNMLSEHMRRQVPVLGSWLEDRSNLSTILEVDKQFWQNINRVRVAGGGRGNYVIAKDDLGNWYVKQYSADPQDVINSARNLAMFSLGPALGAALPINNVLPGSLLKTNLVSSTGKSLLEFQLETFQSNYLAQIKEVYTNLNQTLTKDALKSKIDSAWNTLSTDQTTVSTLTGLSKKAVEPLVPLPAPPQDGSEVERRLNETLMSLVQVHYALDNAVRDSGLDVAIKERARQSATQVLLEQIRTPLQRRRDAITAYMSGVTVLNSSLNQ